MYALHDILVPIACGCVLPIVIVWLVVRSKMNETNQRTKVVLAAIEKNPDMDIEELIKKISPKKKLLKEKLLATLQWGSITSLLGIGILLYGLGYDYKGGGGADLKMFYFVGAILLTVGIAFIAHYRISKKVLAKEIEAEEKRVTALEA